MKNRALSAHIWSAIESQAKTVAGAMTKTNDSYIDASNIEQVNEFELKRLRILIRELEEESPK